MNLVLVEAAKSIRNAVVSRLTITDVANRLKIAVSTVSFAVQK